MGELLRAICSECRFVSEDLYTGFGFKGAGDHSMEPSICPKCFSFKLRDRRHPPQKCYRCKAEVVFYGDRQFSVLFFPDPLHSEAVAEDSTDQLTKGRHVCPECLRAALIFERLGHWD